jgi:hypothetical protein
MKYGYYSDIIGNKTTEPQQQQKKKNICDVEGEGAVNERTCSGGFNGLRVAI